jgi:heterogeneous nuclear ribonucleoprotein U-like protein 1
MVILFTDDSDLNLVIDKENFTSAAPMFDHGFGYIWAGARASYGFVKGKVFYEVKVSKHVLLIHYGSCALDAASFFPDSCLLFYV